MLAKKESIQIDFHFLILFKQPLRQALIQSLAKGM
jgi:hypothetical protein